MREKHQKILDQVVEELRRRRGVEAVLVSGSVARSVARGDFTPYSDIELNVIVDKEFEGDFKDEDLWRSRKIQGVYVEIYYASFESWKKEILSRKEVPRTLNQFFEAKILHDPDGVAKQLVNLAKKAYTEFKYPSHFIKLARFAIEHNKNKILSRLHQGRELAAAIDADLATSWVLRGLAYLFNIPNTEGSRIVEDMLSSRCLTDEF